MRILTRLVYNRHAGLFADGLRFEDVYNTLRFYLWAQSRRPSSPFTTGQRRGFYALKADAALQLDLCFTPFSEPEEKTVRPPEPDYPSLF